MSPQPRPQRGYRCKDDRLHSTLAGANACVHHPEDKGFDSFATLPPLRVPNNTYAVAGLAVVQSSTGEGISDFSAASYIPLSTHTTAISSSRICPPSPALSTLAAPRTGSELPHSTPAARDKEGRNIKTPSAPAKPKASSRLTSSLKENEDKESGPPPTPTPAIAMMDDGTPGPVSLSPSTSPASAPPRSRNLVPVIALQAQQADRSQAQTPSNPTASPTREADHQAQNLAKVRASRNNLVEELNDSRGLVNRLKTRNTINMATHAHELTQVEQDRNSARADAQLAREQMEAVLVARRCTQVQLSNIVMVGVFAAFVWVIFNLPNYQYIWSRQYKHFGM